MLTDYQWMRRKQLLAGLPAILLGCACLLGVIARPFYGVEKKVQRYRSAALAALEVDEKTLDNEGDEPADDATDGETTAVAGRPTVPAQGHDAAQVDSDGNGQDSQGKVTTKTISGEQLEIARVCYEKLWQLDPSDHRSLFIVAHRLMQHTGDSEPIERLAPLHEARCPEAHVWVAQQLLASNPSTSDAGILDKVRTHLEHADSLAKRDLASNATWYQYNMLTEDAPAAIDSLGSVAQQRPQFYYQLMQLQLQQDDQVGASESANQFEKWVRTQMGKGLYDDGRHHLQLLLTMQSMDRMADMLAVVRDAVEKLPDEAELHGQLFATLIGQVSRIIDLAQANSDATPDPISHKGEGTIGGHKLGIADSEVVVQIVQFVQDRDPSNLPALSLVSRLFDTQQESEFVSRVVQSLLGTADRQGDGQGTLAGHWGAMAAAKEDYTEAAALLEVAIKRDPTLATAMNNLAWVLLQSDDPDLDRALTLVSRAIELAPEDHRFRETRGQLLIKLERWDAAIEDLEYAVNRMPDSPKIHESLSKAYAQLGMPELAQAHALRSRE